MATIQWNALSTSLFGSFEALTILPDAAFLRENAGHRYPVLYLLHDNGENAQQFLGMPELEALCNEKQLIICCPWISHSFGCDLRWGGKFGQFAGMEFPGICRNMFPVNNNCAMIGGIGWGAYAACMVARRCPQAFGKVIAYNGCFDAAALCTRIAKEQEDECVSAPMLEAVFGDLNAVAGTEKDLLTVRQPESAVLGCAADCPTAEETRKVAALWRIVVHTGSLAQVIQSAL